MANLAAHVGFDIDIPCLWLPKGHVLPIVDSLSNSPKFP